ncbi:PepSY domain-containing protein [Bradyrhizobium sp.]
MRRYQDNSVWEAAVDAWTGQIIGDGTTTPVSKLDDAGLEETNGRIVYEVTIVSKGATTKFVVDPTNGRTK